MKVILFTLILGVSFSYFWKNAVQNYLSSHIRYLKISILLWKQYYKNYDLSPRNKGNFKCLEKKKIIICHPKLLRKMLWRRHSNKGCFKYLRQQNNLNNTDLYGWQRPLLLILFFFGGRYTLEITNRTVIKKNIISGAIILRIHILTSLY